MARWVKVEKQGSYTFWKRREGGGVVYNVTTTGKVPKTTAGYYSLDYIKKVKGVG